MTMWMVWSRQAMTVHVICILALITGAELSYYDEKGTRELCSFCHCSSDLKTVDCSNRGLTELPDALSDKIIRLNISYNEISSFPENLNKFPNIIELDMSGNQISALPENSLFNLTYLEVLNLSRNQFKSWSSLMPNKVLRPATRLKLLDLSYNKLQTLGNLDSQDLFISSTLETLLLENCEIDSIHGRSPLSGLTNIKVLKLNNNPLRRIQNLISSTLRSLEASYCQLSYVHPESLLYLPSLVHLQMSHNYRLVLATPMNSLLSDSLRYLDISYCNIMEPSVGGFPNLRKAVISHNMIRFLTNTVFNNNSKLEYLDMSYNSIGTLKSNTFQGLVQLKYLDLSWNEIAYIPEKALLQTPLLSQVNLSRNYLTKVGHLKSLSLTLLDMSQCEIDSISKDSLEGLQSLVDLNLSRNIISRIPDSISSNTLQYLNLNYNRITTINNNTFFMLPRLTTLAVVGNRFTSIWIRDYFKSNPYLELIDLNDNMWRCDCTDKNMYDFYEYLTLEPNKKEESYSLQCNSPNSLYGQTWFEACFFIWYPSEGTIKADGLLWFIMVMIIGLALCLVVVSMIRKAMKRRLETIQALRAQQVEEARDRLRQLRMRAEQEAQCNAVDPRDLIAPPSYEQALSMPKLNASCQSLNETRSGKSRKKRGRRRTKSSGDLLEETEREGNTLVEDLEMSEITDDNQRQRRRRRPRKCGSHELRELDRSPGMARRRMSYYDTQESTTTEVDAEMERPLRFKSSRDPNEPSDSDS